MFNLKSVVTSVVLVATVLNVTAASADVRLDGEIASIRSLATNPIFSSTEGFSRYTSLIKRLESKQVALEATRDIINETYAAQLVFDTLGTPSNIDQDLLDSYEVTFAGLEASIEVIEETIPAVRDAVEEYREYALNQMGFHDGIFSHDDHAQNLINGRKGGGDKARAQKNATCFDSAVKLPFHRFHDDGWHFATIFFDTTCSGVFAQAGALGDSKVQVYPEAYTLIDI